MNKRLTPFGALDPSERTCYFCGAATDPEDSNCVEVTIQPRDGTLGMWFCHAGCILPSRHDDAPGFQLIVGGSGRLDE